ncbi:hypothetical protein D3C72_1227190 [compost metagenome]
MLRLLPSDQAGAFKTGILAGSGLLQGAFAARAHFWRQQFKPLHAEARFRCDPECIAAESVHVRQRTIGSDDLDAIHADIQHLGLGQHLLLQ